jgi:predicted dithiol-disulfide oxidoreductase (DUF899 family)
MATHKVVKHDEWLKARKKHLAKEKEFTRIRDQLSRERCELPWELVEKQYTFQGEHGTQTLSDVFEGRSQLIIYHAIFNPDTAGPHTPWTQDAPCLLLLDGQLQRHQKVDYNYRLRSTYERGLLNVAYHYMDLVPKGRDEDDAGADRWVRRRDEYQD